jgi:hypothetical protein
MDSPIFWEPAGGFVAKCENRTARKGFVREFSLSRLLDICSYEPLGTNVSVNGYDHLGQDSVHKRLNANVTSYSCASMPNVVPSAGLNREQRGREAPTESQEENRVRLREASAERNALPSGGPGLFPMEGRRRQ